MPGTLQRGGNTQRILPEYCVPAGVFTQFLNCGASMLKVYRFITFLGIEALYFI